MRYFVRLKLSFLETDFEFPDIDQAAVFAEKMVKSHVAGKDSFNVYILLVTPEPKEDDEIEVQNDGDN